MSHPQLVLPGIPAPLWVPHRGDRIALDGRTYTLGWDHWLQGIRSIDLVDEETGAVLEGVLVSVQLLHWYGTGHLEVIEHVPRQIPGAFICWRCTELLECCACAPAILDGAPAGSAPVGAGLSPAGVSVEISEPVCGFGDGALVSECEHLFAGEVQL